MTEPVWPTLVRHRQKHLRAADLRTWIRPLQPLRDDAEQLVLLAPNDRFVKILEDDYRSLIERVLTELEKPCSLGFTANQLALDLPTPMASMKWRLSTGWPVLRILMLFGTSMDSCR